MFVTKKKYEVLERMLESSQRWNREALSDNTELRQILKKNVAVTASLVDELKKKKEEYKFDLGAALDFITSLPCINKKIKTRNGTETIHDIESCRKCKTLSEMGESPVPDSKPGTKNEQK